MAEKIIPVTYKKNRVPRAAKLWETTSLYNTMHTLSQLKNKIEELATKEGLAVEELKPTMISTFMLWDIAANYELAYKMLMKESLINSGNISKIQPTLN